MAIYLINFISISIYTILIKNKKKLISIILFQMWLIMVLRSCNLGSDMINYSQYYSTWSEYSLHDMIISTRIIQNQQISWGLESGYVWLCWICAQIGMNFQMFLVVHATICIIGLKKLISKYSELPEYSLQLVIAFGIWGTQFYVLRQSLSFVFVVYAFQYILEKKYIRYFLFLLLAILFHRAAIVFLVLYFVRNISISKKTIYIYIASCLIWFIVIPLLYPIIEGFLNIFDKGNLYGLGELQSNFMIVCFILIFILIIFFSHNFILFDNDKNRLLCWCYMLAILVELLSLYVPDFSRIAICVLFPFGLALLGNTINNLKIKTNRILIKNISIIVFFILYIYILFSAEYVPYTTFF